MSFSFSRTAALALVGLAALGVLATPAQAQRILYKPSPFARPQIIPYPVNPNRFVAPNLTASQFLYNSRVLGQAYRNVPPYAFGYNPYPSPIYNSSPIVPYSPYALSTMPGGSPYTSGGTLSSMASGYSLSTTGSPGLNFAPYGFGSGYGYPYGGGWGNQSPFGSYLQGAASLTQATGQYWVSIQQARLMREQSRQASIDTARKRLEFEAYYESMRMTTPKLRAMEAATELDRARKDSPSAEVWSGQALNELLRSIQRAGTTNLNRGPQIALSDDTLTHINLSDKATRSNAGLLKVKDRDGKLSLPWPDLFDGEGYSDARQRLAKKLQEAVESLSKSEKPAGTVLKDISADFDAITKKVNDSTDDLTPSQYIEAKRFLKQLDNAIRALKDPKAANYFNDTWKARGATVGELVRNLSKDGLMFAPATPGDEASYTALYQALRAFEGGLQLAMNQSK